MVLTIVIIPTVSYAASACNHSYDSSCDTDCNLCGATRDAESHAYGEWYSVNEIDENGDLITERRVCDRCGAEDNLVSMSHVIQFSPPTQQTITLQPSVTFPENSFEIELQEPPTFGTSVNDMRRSSVILDCFVGVIGLGILWLGATFIIKATRTAENGADGEDIYEPDNYIDN